MRDPLAIFNSPVAPGKLLQVPGAFLHAALMPLQRSPPDRGRHRPISPVDFANTGACPACRADDALGSAPDARRWLRGQGVRLRGSVSTPVLDRLQKFRTSVRAVLNAAILGTTPPARALDRINRAARRETEWSRLEWRRGRWNSVVRTQNGSVTDLITAGVARSLVTLLAGPDGSKLGKCHGPGCAHLLLARTRQQLWCSPTGCGNRVRVARHYRKVMSPATRPR